MPTVKSIENRIWKNEGFNVRIKDGSRDVRDDRILNASYLIERAAKGSYTVNDWKEKRFKQKFPGFDVDVLDGNGNKVRGNMTLDNVRDTYE